MKNAKRFRTAFPFLPDWASVGDMPWDTTMEMLKGRK